MGVSNHLKIAQSSSKTQGNSVSPQQPNQPSNPQPQRKPVPSKPQNQSPQPLIIDSIRQPLEIKEPIEVTPSQPFVTLPTPSPPAPVPPYLIPIISVIIGALLAAVSTFFLNKFNRDQQISREKGVSKQRYVTHHRRR